MAANLTKAGRKVTGFDLVPGVARRRQGRRRWRLRGRRFEAVKGRAGGRHLCCRPGKHVLSVWTEILPLLAKGFADHRTARPIVRRKRRVQGTCAGGET